MSNAGQQTERSNSLSPLDQRTVAGKLALEVLHEIRNPLEALGYLNYLALRETDNEKVHAYLQLAQEQISTLTLIAGQPLAFAKLSDLRTSIDLVELVEAALRIHQRKFEAKKIHLVRDLPGNLFHDVNRTRILQVVSNLIANALDALPESGTLSTRLRERNDGVYFLIADNGHGISPEQVERIFGSFFTTKTDTGNGLGLALSRRIIEEHGGRLCFRSSVRSGRSGTVFKIFLPL